MVGGIAYILCPGRAGSTLLGALLDTHPDVVHLGELVAPIRKGRPARCRLCPPGTCPIWDHALDSRRVEDAVNVWLNGPKQPSVHALHRDVIRATGAQWVIDGSKKLTWAQHCARDQTLTHRFIFLRRDLRGCLASWKRTAPDRLEATAASAARYVDALERHRQATGASGMLVRYEDLVAEPAPTRDAVLRWLGLGPTTAPADLAPTQHLIGGNPGPLLQHSLATSADSTRLEADMSGPQQAWYRKIGPTITSDERWRDELDSQDLSLYQRVLRPFNQRWGYDA